MSSKVGPALPVSTFRPFAFRDLRQLDQLAAPQLEMVVVLGSEHLAVAAADVATTADSFDSSLLPSASSTYSLLIEIQEAEHKDLLVVEAG